MFDVARIFSGYSVDDLDAAEQFYANVLGLEVEQQQGLLFLRLGDHRPPVLLYPKDNHVPATYTTLNFPVDDIDAAAAELHRRGVEFERYEGFEGADEHGVYRGQGGPPIAWFTDPAGNILSILEEP